MNPTESDWHQIDKRKQQLLAEIWEQLSPEERDILEATLKIEAEHRHLLRPHGLKKSIQDVIKGTIR
jgi:hypothetical protein